MRILYMKKISARPLFPEGPPQNKISQIAEETIIRAEHVSLAYLVSFLYPQSFRNLMKPTKKIRRFLFLFFHIYFQFIHLY